ncbi:DUF4178 domain-containing protein [Rhodobacterales bacterium HKCCE3408]|nr:DUF4178 domain-containing protein [Rhodobacterales bacterium HKCCE3408]
MTDLTCPNCGYGFDALARSTRMFDCPSCGTTLFRARDALGTLGDHGVMHDVPMLVDRGDSVEVSGTDYRIIGHVRFDYGRGTWDELWAVDGAGGGVWISIDEGDVVAQFPVPQGQWPTDDRAPQLGRQIQHNGHTYTVTEHDRATAVAIRGELPEILNIGEAHEFVNATDAEGYLLSGEFWEEETGTGRAWYEGAWIDPFELKVTRG